MRAVSVLVISVFVVGCRYKLPKYDYAKEPDPRNKELVLGVGDAIDINVWENKELNTSATIRPDGTITMPLVGDLKAAGETPTSLKKNISNRLSQFIRVQQGSDPVTIAVRSWKSYRFTIQGEVSRQGVYTPDQFVTIADAIAMAGGPTRFAKRSQVKLFRTDPVTKQTRIIPLNYDEISSGRRLDMNIYVLAGDVLYLP